MPLKALRLEQIEDQHHDQRWLVENLWVHEGVGLIGGEPKTCKSWLALDIALSVGAGAKCLGKFPAAAPRNVLYIAGEDRLTDVKRRLCAIAKAKGVDPLAANILLTDNSCLDLCSPSSISQLESLCMEHEIGLIILDPLIRFHRAAENSSIAMGSLLSNLRLLQRSLRASVIVVHHFKKTKTQTRGGQALRGSSELHAWGDSNLYLHHGLNGVIKVTVEHRSAPSIDPIPMKLTTTDDGVALQVYEEEKLSEAADLPASIVKVVSESHSPISASEIVRRIKKRKSNVLKEVQKLKQQGTLADSDGGIKLPNYDLGFPESLFVDPDNQEPVPGTTN